MVDLRQRHINQANGSPTNEAPRLAGNKLTNTVKGKCSSILSDRASILVFSLAFSCVVFLLYRRQQGPLPASYALCSRSGQRIYTVDDAGSRVQCVAVHYSEIVDTGSLGEKIF